MTLNQPWCHSTLDPLAYSFSPYVALKSRRNGNALLPAGSYDEKRQQWEALGYLMGQPVKNLMEWANVAAQSDAFKMNLVKMFYQNALGREPKNQVEKDEFTALWKSLPEGGYSADKLLARLVATRSFGSMGPTPSPNAIWKRHNVVAHDLQRALKLSPGDWCKELGAYACVDTVFLNALGGNDPIGKAQFKPMAEAGVTTPIALERVALQACSKRVSSDAQGSPQVFTQVDLKSASLLGHESQVDAMNQNLYRILLSRDASQEELDTLRQLLVTEAQTPVKAQDVAKLSCFVVATSREFAFF